MASIADILKSKGIALPKIAPPVVSAKPYHRKRICRMHKGVAKSLYRDQAKRETRMAVACQYGFMFGIRGRV